MHVPLSAAVVPKLVVLDECSSTNEMLLASSGTEPHLSTLLTTHQTAGRGRLRRAWFAPPGQSLAVSVLVRPKGSDGMPLRAAEFGWFPLVAGLAMTRAVASVVPAGDVRLKWPNDVQVRGLKVSGVLSEVVPAGDALVIGAGVNLAIPADALPTPVSTSLGLEGATLEGDDLTDAVLSTFLRELSSLVGALEQHDGDGEASGARADFVAVCATLGRDVRVELPGDRELRGVATAIDGEGRLVVTTADGAVSAVSVGDITHVR